MNVQGVIVIKKTDGKEHPKQRYKKLLAAVAGAAALSSTLISGIDVEKVYAYGQNVYANQNVKLPSESVSSTIANAQNIEVAKLLLYNTDIYNDWQWNDPSYPSDMVLGMLASDPKTSGAAGNLPESSLKLVDGVDFTRNLVFYAHIGAGATGGRDIAISSIGQVENNVTVTIRVKNSGTNQAKVDDFVRIPRGTLDFRHEINIIFEDPKGGFLAQQTLMPS
ncbi:MAG: hypothetical protein H6Q74_1479 [Firmicutes bacterium]|nr:hypothetical protein [Bacillota bacterium]